MTATALVINVGSSNAKVALYDSNAKPLLREVLPVSKLDIFLDGIRTQGPSISVVGHRVVHGGADFAHATRIDARTLALLRDLIPLAPLHQPHCIEAIERVAALFPHTPQVACFDTAFHATQSFTARTYALPRALTEAGVRRYGFHGLSYESIARALPDYLGERADGRVVVAHLGSGASACALCARKSVATTMGFTPLDGLMMGTRCGALDPGVVLHLIRERGMSVAQVEQVLYRESGLLGVSGSSADMRELLDSESPQAREAVDLFVHRAVREIASLAAALQGLDALVFTGGIGEHAAEIRARVCAQLAWLGLHYDEAANTVHGPRITRADSPVSAWVIPAREDDVIARHTLSVLRSIPDSTNADR